MRWNFSKCIVPFHFRTGLTSHIMDFKKRPMCLSALNSVEDRYFGKRNSAFFQVVPSFRKRPLLIVFRNDLLPLTKLRVKFSKYWQKNFVLGHESHTTVYFFVKSVPLGDKHVFKGTSISHNHLQKNFFNPWYSQRKQHAFKWRYFHKICKEKVAKKSPTRASS